MSIEVIIILIIMAAGFVLFVSEALPIDITALCMLAAMLCTGLLGVEEAFSGFSNPAVITIASLFVLSQALNNTHVLEFLVVSISKLAEKSLALGMTLYLLCIALASAVVNNTAIVAIFMPITIRMAERHQVSPSKVLIPLSYAAILGGTLTLVGTSTNLLVNSIMQTTGPGDFKPLGMFEFARYGAIHLSIGLLYIVLIAYRLLPSRTTTSSLTRNYRLGGYLTELKVSPESPLVGRTCLERGINKIYDVMVLDIQRGEDLISVNIRNTRLQAGDVLFVRGSVENILRMKAVENVKLLTDEPLTVNELEQDDNLVAECLLKHESAMIGSSIKDLDFRRRRGLLVLAIRREGEIFRHRIANIALNAYDTLLVYGPRERVSELAQSGDFIATQELDLPMQRPRFWWMALVVIIAAVLLAALGLVPIAKGALVGAVLLVVFRVVSATEVYKCINWQVIILIAALLPLGIAIQSTGTAAWIGRMMTGAVDLVPEASRPMALLCLVYLVTMILTEISSNAATAIIMTPVVLVASASMNLDPRPYIFAVCFAASSSFITPVGYQTNLMVYGPGGYRFTDYMRTGLPLALILWLTATILIPRLWPLAG